MFGPRFIGCYFGREKGFCLQKKETFQVVSFSGLSQQDRRLNWDVKQSIVACYQGLLIGQKALQLSARFHMEYLLQDRGRNSEITRRRSRKVAWFLLEKYLIDPSDHFGILTIKMQEGEANHWWIDFGSMQWPVLVAREKEISAKSIFDYFAKILAMESPERTILVRIWLIVAFFNSDCLLSGFVNLGSVFKAINSCGKQSWVRCCSALGEQVKNYWYMAAASWSFL